MERHDAALSAVFLRLVDKGKTGNGSGEMEIRSAVELIGKKQGTKIIFVTDNHHGTDGKDCRENLRFAMETAVLVNAAAIVDGGDFGNDYAVHKTRILESYLELMDCYRESKVPVFWVMGNHDDATGIHKGKRLDEKNCFSPRELHEIFRDRGNGAVFDAHHPFGNYFYRDVGDVRLIGLNTSDIPFDEDTGCYAENSYDCLELSAVQLEWLKKEALSTSRDILVFSHAPLINAEMEGCTEEPKRGAEAFSLLCEARNVAGVFSGHTHWDNFSANLPIPRLTSVGFYGGVGELADYPYSFDCICVGKQSIDVIRIGKGENRSWKRRDAKC